MSSKRTIGELAGDAVTPAAKKVSATENKGKAPKSVVDKIIWAIRYLKSSSGSSALAVHKACLTELSYDNLKAIKKALQTGVKTGVFEQNKMSYLVKGDPAYEDTTEKVTIEELVVGMGSAPAGKGDTCTISYVGTLLSTGAKFESASAFTFTVGAGDVIKGMDAGVMGMCVGGKRKVSIPASLAYGRRGSAPEIPPDACLQFQFILKDIS
jgi:FKBP-type peptidyl-prolyl cis-trans isomerase